MQLPEMQTPAPAPIQPPPEDDVNALQKLALMNLLNKLVKLAQANGPHQEGADLILEKAPDEVIEFLDSDDTAWWDVLAQAAPQVAPHREWFFAVQKLVRAGLDEPEGETK